MKILISADMEGISGVVHWDQVTPGHDEYQRFRKIMTADVNAAVAGAFDGGAGEVAVTDGHWAGLNLLIEELDARAHLNSGLDSPLSMVQGVEDGVDGIFFIGYHARSGTHNAVLAHTWSSSRVANVWVNNTLVGEFGLNAALAGHFNVPVLMVTGDQTTCAQTAELLGPMEAVVVKYATGFQSADCIPPSDTVKRIHEAATRAIKSYRVKPRKPYKLTEPVHVTIEFLQPMHADRAERLPGSKRLDALRVEFVAPDMLVAYTGFRAVVKLSAD